MNTFRHSASFGKRIEYWVIGRMLKEGMDVYIPLVDDHAVDAVVERPDGSIAHVQIKARSLTCAETVAAFFAGIPPEEKRDYWFVFYSERMDMTWILTSAEFIAESTPTRSGKNVLRDIKFNGRRKNETYCKARYEKYLAKDFSRIAKMSPNELRIRVAGRVESTHPPLK